MTNEFHQNANARTHMTLYLYLSVSVSVSVHSVNDILTIMQIFSVDKYPTHFHYIHAFEHYIKFDKSEFLVFLLYLRVFFLLVDVNIFWRSDTHNHFLSVYCLMALSYPLYVIDFNLCKIKLICWMYHITILQCVPINIHISLFYYTHWLVIGLYSFGVFRLSCVCYVVCVYVVSFHLKLYNDQKYISKKTWIYIHALPRSFVHATCMVCYFITHNMSNDMNDISTQTPNVLCRIFVCLCAVLDIVASASAAAAATIAYVFIVFVLKFNVIRSDISSNCYICEPFFFFDWLHLQKEANRN